MVCLIQCTGSQLGRSERCLVLSEDHSDGLYQDGQGEKLRQRSRYGIHNQEWRGSKQHEDEGELCDLSPMRYVIEFLRFEDGGELFL